MKAVCAENRDPAGSLSVKRQREISSAHSRERACEDVGVAGAMLVIAPSPANGLARLGEIVYFTIVKLKKSADDSRRKTVRPFSRAHAECEELAPRSSLAPKGDTRGGNDRRARHLRGYARRHAAGAGCVQARQGRALSGSLRGRTSQQGYAGTGRC